MKTRAFPLCLAFVGVALLSLVAAAPAAATAEQAEAVGCRGCDLFEETCITSCLGLEDREDARACLMACDSAVAACSCDEAPTLSSEEAVRRGLGGTRQVPSSAGACHSTTPCPASYSSCAGWSSYQDCGSTFCGGQVGCAPCGPPDFCMDVATKKFRERFRVCFDSGGNSCTEYQRISVSLGCGC